jgi:uncharacterized protein
MDLRNRVREVLAGTHLMSLSTRDDAGLWAADVIFVFDDELNLYWMSDPTARHSKAIVENGEVAGTVTSSVVGKVPNFGVQFAGRAEKLEGARYDLAIKHAAKRGRPAPLENEDVLNGRSWYKLELTKLHLIDEENFGYDAQEVPLA